MVVPRPATDRRARTLICFAQPTASGPRSAHNSFRSPRKPRLRAQRQSGDYWIPVGLPVERSVEPAVRLQDGSFRFLLELPNLKPIDETDCGESLDH